MEWKRRETEGASKLCVNVALRGSEVEQRGGSLSLTRQRVDGHRRPWTLMDAASDTSFT